MAKTTVYNQAGDKVKEIELNPKVFGVEVKPEVVSQAINIQQANARAVLAHAKDRSEISGGGRKPWRQKGTGRARHGSIRSPLWRGGGVTFGPSNDRNFELKINKKEKRKALLMGLSDKAAHDKVIVLDAFSLEEAKTKKFNDVLKNLKLREVKPGKDEKKKPEPRVLVVLPEKNEAAYKASRNIVKADTILANNLNVADVVKAQYLVIPESAISVIEKTFVK